jgi:hypothetical protein
VPEPLHPEVLVVAEKRWPVLRESPAIAAGHHHLPIRDVPEQFQDRPFLWSRAAAKVRTSRLEERAQYRRRLALDASWVIVPQEGDQVLLVRGRVGDRVG